MPTPMLKLTPNEPIQEHRGWLIAFNWIDGSISMQRTSGVMRVVTCYPGPNTPMASDREFTAYVDSVIDTLEKMDG